VGTTAVAVIVDEDPEISAISTPLGLLFQSAELGNVAEVRDVLPVEPG